MSDVFWVEALNHVSYLVNKSPSTVINFQIPEEIWRGESVEPDEFFVVQRIVLLIVRKRSNGSPSLLESKSKKCIFIGFTKRVKGFSL